MMVLRDAACEFCGELVVWGRSKFDGWVPIEPWSIASVVEPVRTRFRKRDVIVPRFDESEGHVAHLGFHSCVPGQAARRRRIMSRKDGFVVWWLHADGTWRAICPGQLEMPAPIFDDEWAALDYMRFWWSLRELRFVAHFDCGNLCGCPRCRGGPAHRPKLEIAALAAESGEP